jgi:hypothetical protein
MEHSYDRLESEIGDKSQNFSLSCDFSLENAAVNNILFCYSCRVQCPTIIMTPLDTNISQELPISDLNVIMIERFGTLPEARISYQAVVSKSFNCSITQ